MPRAGGLGKGAIAGKSIMLIGVVSDTHGQASYCRQAIDVLESFNPQAVLHCGDIGSSEIVELFAPWPTHFVFGNVDYDQSSLRAAIEQAGQTCHGPFASIELAGKKIAMLHGDDTLRLAQETRGGQWDLVCHGHTHVARNEKVGGTLVLNPGALYRARPHSLAIVELLDEVRATIITL